MNGEAGDEVPIVWRGRRVRAFVPHRLADRDLALATDTINRTAQALAGVEFGAETLPDDYLPLARLLLRAEGVASSFIDGVSAPVIDVVLAESDALVAAGVLVEHGTVPPSAGAVPAGSTSAPNSWA